MKVLMVTNIPAPYRLPIYEIINERLGDNFKVVFCASLEPTRQWVLDKFKFNHTFLKERKVYEKPNEYFTNYVHNNPDVFKEIRRFDPDIIINTGYNPTNLYAWSKTLFNKRKHVVMTDGTLTSELHLGFIHRLVRRLVFKTSASFIGASEGSKNLYDSYKILDNNFFKSYLCINNEMFSNSNSFEDRKFDLMFSGRFLKGKLPFFFAEVANQVKERIGNIKVLILGDGELKKEFLARLKELELDFEYAGFVSQESLPNYYGNSKLFLFPTMNDTWGVVANEALASGMPVITTPYAGVENDLIVNNKTGYVLEPEVDLWVEKAVAILKDKVKWSIMSNEGKKHVQNYNFKDAAEGIIEAAKLAHNF